MTIISRSHRRCFVELIYFSYSRIDTCIVGDDSTCDASQHEICRTEGGVSAWHCRPGHARRKHRDPCRKVVSVLVSLRVDRLYERRVVWANELANTATDSYQQLSYEAERAVSNWIKLWWILHYLKAKGILIISMVRYQLSLPIFQR